MQKVNFLFFISVLNLSSAVLGHEISVDTYKSANTTVNSVDLSWKQKADESSKDENSLFEVLLAYSLGHTDAFDLNNTKVNLTTNEFSASIGLCTPDYDVYTLGYSNNVEKKVDVIFNSLFLQYSKKFIYDEEDFLNKFKVKARADFNYIQHSPVTPISFDTDLLRYSTRLSTYFYFNKVLNLNLGYKKFFYNKNMDTFVVDLKSVSSNSLTNIFANEAASYADYTLSAGLGFNLTDLLDIDLYYARTQPKYSTASTNQDYSIALNFDLQSGLNLAAEFGSTNYISSAGISTSASTYSQFSLGYSF